jgi:HSP20 family protein
LPQSRKQAASSSTRSKLSIGCANIYRGISSLHRLFHNRNIRWDEVWEQDPLPSKVTSGQKRPAQAERFSIHLLTCTNLARVKIFIVLIDFEPKENPTMREAVTKLPVKMSETGKGVATRQSWQPFESLRREVDRLFDDFGGGIWSTPFRRSMFDGEPFWRREIEWPATPAVDVSENDKAYEIAAELPGMTEKDIEVSLANGTLIIKGEKQEEKEEKKKNYYLSERRFGSFERRFGVLDGVDSNKIEASFQKGVLKVTLPKTAEAQQPEKKIAVKAA